MKILNLYAGIGGNRKMWGDEHDITAVEWDKETANVYQDYFPNDTVIVDDAHEYLLNNFKQYNFIWTSPPCPTHSRIRKHVAVGRGQNEPVYPDMKLWQEIIFLDNHFDGKWVVENVVPYYEPLIPPTKKLHRHLYWANFRIGNFDEYDKDRKHNKIKSDSTIYGFNVSKYNLDNKTKNLRNMVDPKLGKYILDRAQDIIVKSDTEQTALF